jgi:hypothetical protein
MFDRIVIHGYLSGLSRPEQAVHFVRHVPGNPGGKQGGTQPAHRRLPQLGGGLCPQSQNSHGVGRERPAQRGLRAACSTLYGETRAYGVYFIFKSMEQGRTFRITVPKYPTGIPTTASWRISAAASLIITSTSAMRFWGRSSSVWPVSFPSHATYWLNGHSFIERELLRVGIAFHKDDNAFLAVDDVAALQALPTA